MTGLPDCSSVQALRRAGVVFFVFSAVAFSVAARAQTFLPNAITTRSLSGQFVVIGERRVSPFASEPAVITNASLVRLEPALLAISAERFKDALWRALGVSGPWRGQIFLALRPAQSPGDNVFVISTRYNSGWIYRVELPDIISRARLAHALSGVLLLELANRDAGERSAEIPAWLADGLAQQLLADSLSGLFFSPPTKVENHVTADRIVAVRRGVDPLAEARRVLQDRPALTFDQLSWPDGAQMSGGDGGVYFASAQLFVCDLLQLPGGAARLRAMLETLPQYYNWQTAFRAVFSVEFPTPLDLEKWWALQTVSFIARDAGPQWTPVVSLQKLDEILSVPVDFRSASNDLPLLKEISLQDAIRTLEPAQQAEVLQTKLRDLELAQLRMAAPLAALNDQYRRTLAAYLGEGGVATRTAWVRHAPRRPGSAETLKALDALDAQRRALEAAVQADIMTRQSQNH
jgi:hypothetical protein